jgi:hypothetical protein
MYSQVDSEPTKDSSEPGVCEQLQVAMYAFRHFPLTVELTTDIQLAGDFPGLGDLLIPWASEDMKEALRNYAAKNDKCKIMVAQGDEERARLLKSIGELLV